MREGTVEVSDAFNIVCKICGGSDIAVESRDQQLLDFSNPSSHDKLRFSYDVHLVCNGCNTSSQIWSTVTPPVSVVGRKSA